MSHVDDLHEATGIALVADLTHLRANEHDARYPNLLFGPWDQQAPAWQRVRSASGLHAVMIEQRALSEAQRRELGAFRFLQFFVYHRYLHSCPTRRSSELAVAGTSLSRAQA